MDGTAHEFRDALTDGQPQTGPLDGLDFFIIRPLKGLEDSI